MTNSNCSGSNASGESRRSRSSASQAPVFVGYCTTAIPGSEERHLAKRGAVTLEFVEDLARLVESVD
ncbi:hypothetical protein ABID19_002891 [Mesorhizobium robiniae]|uniref:Uncharacterized protein n=1 Tax=Mesorhizobium robiniae TaxID=559315 RepID=A0ABV2GNI2_9HYPH